MITHNHITRGIMPLGMCPACDIYHEKRTTGAAIAQKDIIKMAVETLAKNKSCLVAQFIIENPTIKADEIEIVQQMNRGEINFSVRKKQI